MSSFLFGAKPCEKIWNLRNKKVFEGKAPNFETLKSCHFKNFVEHSNVRTVSNSSVQVKRPYSWSKPAMSTIKFNVDAEVGQSRAAVAIVVRDCKGILFLACSKAVDSNNPLQDKAKAWAAYITSQSNYQAVIFEGDSLTCITAVLSKGTNVPWRIKNVIQEITALTGVVPHASSCWVPREANGATTSLAKWSLKNRFVSSFDLCNCPYNVSDILRVETC
nr:hypothetical protein CFP56_79157 [Quercus suber]